MDDRGPKKLDTSSRGTRHLKYGHFGNAAFSETRHEWRFLRSAAEHSTQEFESTTAQRFLLRDDSCSSRDADTQECSVSQFSKRRGRFRHEEALLQRFGSGSNTTPHPSPTRGACLASGYAPSRHPHRSTQWIPLIASTRDCTSNVLRLNLLTSQPTPQKEESGLPGVVDLPQISEAFAEVHLPSSSPLLHVQMITDFDNARSLISIRQTTATTLLLHQYEGRSQDTSSPTASNDLIAKPVLTIPISRTGGQSHAAFALCSDGRYHRLGIIDVHGNWSVWHIRAQKHVSTRSLSSARLEYSGKLFAWQGRRRPAHIQPFFDGWHRVLWLQRRRSDEKLLLVCNRQVVQMFDALGQPLGDVDIQLRLGSDEWLLDVQRLYQHPNVSVILTTSRLLTLSLTRDKRPLNLLCSWDHFHGSTDLQYKMSIIEFPYDVHVLLYTTRSPGVTFYAFYFPGDEDALVVSASEPTGVRLPAALSSTYSDISDITFLFVRQGAATASELRRPSFIKIIALLNDGTLFEALYHYNHPNVFELDAAEHLVLRIPEVGKGRYRSSTTVDDDDDMYDFVVSDTHDNNKRLVISNQRTRQTMSAEARTATFLSKNWSGLLDRLTAQRRDAPLLGEDISYVVERVSSSNSPCLLHTLLAQAQADDIDATSRAISEVNATVSTHLTHVDRQGPASLLDQHTALFQKHVTALPAEVPDYVRASLERVVRLAAVDKVLASQLVSGKTPDTGVPLSRELGTKVWVEASAGSRDPHISRLNSLLAPIRKHTRVETLAPLNMETQGMSAMLAHLPENISVNPNDYSYEDAELSRALSRNELASHSMDERSKQRAEKRAEVQRRKFDRQRRERERIELERALLPNILMSDQLPVRTTVSQPGFSSQSTAVPEVMTQPDRGLFGGRQRGKGTTKPMRPRRAGF